nr:hypothetical protein [Pantoea cypripedii]
MTEKMPVITEEQRQRLIYDCKAEIAYLEEQQPLVPIRSRLIRQKIVMASLTAEPIGYHREEAREAFRVLPFDDGVYKIAVYAAPAVPVLNPVITPSFDDYQPHIAKELRAAFNQAVRAAGYPIAGEDNAAAPGGNHA